MSPCTAVLLKISASCTRRYIHGVTLFCGPRGLFPSRGSLALSLVMYLLFLFALYLFFFLYPGVFPALFARRYHHRRGNHHHPPEGRKNPVRIIYVKKKNKVSTCSHSRARSLPPIFRQTNDRFPFFSQGIALRKRGASTRSPTAVRGP